MARSFSLLNLLNLLIGGLLAVPVAVVAGSASAFFLWALDAVTRLQWQHPGLLGLLPLAGVGVGWLYQRFGKGSDRGNNLLLDEIHEPGGGVPARMAPLVLLGTLVTHLCGGSAGREGTAVQMGGSLAGWLARLFRLGRENRRLLLLCGIAAGFGSVFGTPLAGAIFAMEVLVIGRLQYDVLLPVLVAGLVGDATCTAWGVEHTVYQIVLAAGAPDPLQASLLAKAALAGVVFGLASLLFSRLTHGLQRGFARLVPFAPLRPALGGLMVLLLVGLAGTRDYLGLGVEAPPGGQVSITAAFQAGGAEPFSWLWKTVFTAVTLASGFKGGEVTPLFFIGATLGHSLALLMGEPVALFAALGFLAVFAGAANTPLACTVMGIELFGGQYAVGFAIACFSAYLVSGHPGIYSAQRLGGIKKVGVFGRSDHNLRERGRDSESQI
jgi:H+/Cl- antiporter ClcA